MRKYLYQITMRIFPVYFTAIVIAVVIFALFFTAPKVHAQTNHVNFNSVLASLPLTSSSLIEEEIIIPDDAIPQIEIVNHDVDQYVDVHVNRTITNIIVFDDHNQEVEDLNVDMKNHHVDTSSLCPGIYYIRVDYTNGSSLRPLVIR